MSFCAISYNADHSIKKLQESPDELMDVCTQRNIVISDKSQVLLVIDRKKKYQCVTINERVNFTARVKNTNPTILRLI